MSNSPTVLKERVTLDVNKSVRSEDHKRLRGQNERLFWRLTTGPITNMQIMTELRIGNHTGRLSDLKKAGCVITGRSQGKGIWLYEMTSYPSGLVGPR